MSRNFKWGDSEMRNHRGLSPQGVQGAGAPARCRRWACLLQNRCGCPSTEALIGVHTSNCRIWRDRDRASAIRLCERKPQRKGRAQRRGPWDPVAAESGAVLGAPAPGAVALFKAALDLRPPSSEAPLALCSGGKSGPQALCPCRRLGLRRVFV